MPAHALCVFKCVLKPVARDLSIQAHSRGVVLPAVCAQTCTHLLQVVHIPVKKRTGASRSIKVVVIVPNGLVASVTEGLLAYTDHPVASLFFFNAFSTVWALHGVLSHPLLSIIIALSVPSAPRLVIFTAARVLGPFTAGHVAGEASSKVANWADKLCFAFLHDCHTSTISLCALMCVRVASLVRPKAHLVVPLHLIWAEGRLGIALRKVIPTSERASNGKDLVTELSLAVLPHAASAYSMLVSACRTEGHVFDRLGLDADRALKSGLRRGFRSRVVNSRHTSVYICRGGSLP